MVKIRLRRMGAKKAPPCVSPAQITIDADRAREWIKTGAQPTETVRALLKKVDVL